MGDKLSDIREGEQVFISYFDDDDKTVSGYVVFISMFDNLITFKTNYNQVTIPTSRLLKLKRSSENEKSRKKFFKQ